MKRRMLSLFMCLVMLCSVLPLVYAADTRTEISSVKIIGEGFENIPVSGGAIRICEFETVEGFPAYLKTFYGKWQKYHDGEWVTMKNGMFTSGEWRYIVELYVDEDYSSEYVLEKTTSLEVNGVEWTSTGVSYIGSNYSRVEYASQNFTVTPPDELTFHESGWEGSSSLSAGVAIKPFTVALYAEGGTAPYVFSKASGPSWIQVANNGEISGTPDKSGVNSDLVVRVTDAVGDYRDITIAVPSANDNEVVEVSTWAELEEAFNSREKTVYTIKLMADLSADAGDALRSQQSMYTFNVNASDVIFDFNGHTLRATDDESDTDAEYSLRDFIKFVLWPKSYSVGSTLRFVDSVGDGGIYMFSKRLHDLNLSVLNVVGGRQYYVDTSSGPILQTTSDISSKVIFDGGNFELLAQTNKFGGGTTSHDVYYRGAVVTSNIYTEINKGSFIATGEGWDSKYGDMCARELTAFGTYDDNGRNGERDDLTVINGGLFKCNGYSIHHFDKAYYVNKTQFMNFPAINGGLFVGRIGYTGMTFTYTDGCSELNKLPATKILSDTAYVKAVNGKGKLVSSLDGLTLKDLHEMKELFILSTEAIKLESTPTADSANVNFVRYNGQTETFSISYEIPDWVTLLPGIDYSPVFTAEKPDGTVIYTNSSKKLTVDYDYFQDDNVVIKQGLKFSFGGDEIWVGTTYNISLVEGKSPAVIIKQPDNISFAPGQRAYAAITADHAAAYEWHVVYNGEDYLASANPINGINFNKYSTDRMNIAATICKKFEVYCIVTGTDGSKTMSESATITAGAAPAVAVFTGGSVGSNGSTIFRIGGRYIESVEWVISKPVPSDRPGEPGYEVSTLNEFIASNRGVRAVEDVKVTDIGVVATLIFIGLHDNADRYYVNAMVSNEIGKTLAGNDAGIKMEFAAAAPVITAHPVDSSCGVGGTLSYIMTASGMASSKWIFEYTVGKETESFTIDQMMEKFPEITFTMTHDGDTATLTISGAVDELNRYKVYAVAVGESASTNSFTAKITVSDYGYIPGDANGDELVNIMDVTAMLQYIAKWNVEIDTVAADVVRDGTMNLSDVTLLLKYIAKWNVELE